MLGLDKYKFANPELLWLLLLLPVLAAWFIWQYRNRYSEQKISTLQAFGDMGRPIKEYFSYLIPILRLAAVGLIIIAIARPQTMFDKEKITTEGIDIVMVMDVSSSMLARDFDPNRLEAAKDVGISFINGRPNDRFGLVVFAGESFTQSPITTDHEVVKNMLNETKSGLIEDGTAIGMGLATAVDRLKESEAKSKVIILLTDGVNNSGFIDPLTAAEVAEKYGIRVYTIGVGSKGTAPYPVQTPFGERYQQMEVKIDEDLLKKIAGMTGGNYFRATDNQSLKEIYDQIDKLEKTKIEVSSFTRYTEKFLPFALLGSILLLFEVLLRFTVFRTFP